MAKHLQYIVCGSFDVTETAVDNRRLAPTTLAPPSPADAGHQTSITGITGVTGIASPRRVGSSAIWHYWVTSSARDCKR
jgi:hypothetical protein